MTPMRNLAATLACAAGFGLAGCGGNKPPFSPADTLKSFRLPEEFCIDLVASEPDVVHPVAMAFDERGRLYVVEMIDYPLNPKPLGRVKLLEDRDGDGRYERSVIFASELHMPNGVMPWKKGVLVTCAPDILYLEDSTGDGRADVRRVVLTGFAATNPQLRVNGLLYSIDNWIYAAYPRVPTPRRYVKEFGDPGQAVRFPDRPEIPPVEMRSQDLRFHPDKHRLEPVAGNSQFGNAFDAWGNRYTLWNNDHVRHVVVENRYLARNPHLAVPLAMQSISDHESQAAVYPITVNPLVIHDTQAGRFTSACGLSVYTGGAFPAGLEGNTFTCEPVHNLVHRDIPAPQGATFTARRAYEGREFLASTDAWFRPVFTTSGPDGALYLVDYYRYTVEHPEFVPPQLLKRIDFEARQRLGRIWRVSHRSAKPAPRPNLAQASSAELVGHLSSPNSWWRINAQRLLADRQDGSVVPSLGKLARQGQPPVARAHALWTLEALGLLANEQILAAMGDPEPRVREHGIRLAESRLADPKIRARLLALAGDPDDKVQFQAACTLGSLPESESFAALKGVALRHAEDPWFQIAALTSAGENALSWYRAIPKQHQALLRRIASITGARKKDAEIAELLTVVARGRGEGDAGWRVATLEGLADGLRQGRSRLPAAQVQLIGMLAGSSPAVDKAALRVAQALEMAPSAELRALTARAATTAEHSNAGTADREVAIGILSLDASGASLPRLARLLDPHQPEEIQTAAAAALSRRPGETVAPIFLERWRGATAKVRETMLAGLAGRGRWPALLQAVEDGVIQPWALGPARTRQLLSHRDPQIRARAERLLGEAAQGDRKTVYDKYLPAIDRPGDPGRGRAVFERACAECHRAGNTGFEVGPDLRGVAQRYKETLLADILMPNQNIEGGYEEYLVETADGRQISGVLARETPTTLVLRRKKGEEDTVLRAGVRSLRSLSVSPMPEDLEKSVTIDQMADLIAYVKSLK